MNILEEREIETHTTYNFYSARTAAIDAERRGKLAVELHGDFFNDPAHIDRVEKTKSVVKSFFNGAKVYVNQRGLGTRSKSPFTVVKVEKPLFPNSLLMQEKQDRFYKPLQDLGVEIVFAKGSNSYLFRIK
jgi:hypothetical protein